MPATTGNAAQPSSLVSEQVTSTSEQLTTSEKGSSTSRQDNPEQESQPSRYSTKTRRAPAYLQDYEH